MAFTKLIWSIACLLMPLSSALAVEDVQIENPRIKLVLIDTKILASAKHDLQVKRLKRLLKQKKISSERFFGEIHEIMNKKPMNR